MSEILNNRFNKTTYTYFDVAKTAARPGLPAVALAEAGSVLQSKTYRGMRPAY